MILFIREKDSVYLPLEGMGIDIGGGIGKEYAVALKDKAIAISGNYIRNFKINGKTYGHIIDSKTGYPVSNDVKLVSVVAPTCTAAGIFSTSAFILGREEGAKLIERAYQIEGVIFSDNSKIKSRRFSQYEIRK